MTGKFIVVEGVDGSGKSTQIQRLADSLKEENIDVVSMSIIPEDEIGDRVRQMLSDGSFDKLSPDEQADLFYQVIDYQLHTNIIPLLQEGKHVVCDRYVHSLYVYQNKSSKVEEYVNKLLDTLLPDVTVLLTLSKEDYIGRLTKRDNLQSTEILDENEVMCRIKLYMTLSQNLLIKRGMRFRVFNTSIQNEKTLSDRLLLSVTTLINK